MNVCIFGTNAVNETCIPTLRKSFDCFKTILDKTLTQEFLLKLMI